jgi:excisionase family DNA binding protein
MCTVCTTYTAYTAGRGKHVEVLTPEQAALELAISAATIRRWCRAGKIRGAVRAGRQWRFTREALAAALAAFNATERRETSNMVQLAALSG